MRTIKRLLRAVFTKPERPTYFEIELTDNAGIVLRALTPEAKAWAEEWLVESRRPNGDYLASRALVNAIMSHAPECGWLVRFV